MRFLNNFFSTSLSPNTLSTFTKKKQPKTTRHAISSHIALGNESSSSYNYYLRKIAHSHLLIFVHFISCVVGRCMCMLASVSHVLCSMCVTNDRICAQTKILERNTWSTKRMWFFLSLHSLLAFFSQYVVLSLKNCRELRKRYKRKKRGIVGLFVFGGRG